MASLPQFLHSPRVVATVHRPEDLFSLAKTSVGPETCDLLEFRLDNLRNHLDAAAAAISASPLPCLITARHPAEGGAGSLDDVARTDLLLRFLPSAQLVDVEVRSLTALAEVIEAARQAGQGVVASCHDFGKTLPRAELEEAITAARAGGADAVKVAMTLNSMEDLGTLAALTESVVSGGFPMSCMGMGRFGKVSRLVLAAAGSCLNYGYLQEPNAPGQWPAAELKRLISEVVPAP